MHQHFLSIIICLAFPVLGISIECNSTKVSVWNEPNMTKSWSVACVQNITIFPCDDYFLCNKNFCWNTSQIGLNDVPLSYDLGGPYHCKANDSNTTDIVHGNASWYPSRGGTNLYFHRHVISQDLVTLEFACENNKSLPESVNNISISIHYSDATAYTIRPNTLMNLNPKLTTFVQSITIDDLKSRQTNENIIVNATCQSLQNGILRNISSPITLLYKLNGGWSSWTQESGCKATCYLGQQMYTRKCDNPVPRGIGHHCGNDSYKIVDCHSSILCKELIIVIAISILALIFLIFGVVCCGLCIKYKNVNNNNGEPDVENKTVLTKSYSQDSYLVPNPVYDKKQRVILTETFIESPRTSSSYDNNSHNQTSLQNNNTNTVKEVPNTLPRPKLVNYNLKTNTFEPHNFTALPSTPDTQTEIRLQPGRTDKESIEEVYSCGMYTSMTNRESQELYEETDVDKINLTVEENEKTTTVDQFQPQINATSVNNKIRNDLAKSKDQTDSIIEEVYGSDDENMETVVAADTEKATNNEPSELNNKIKQEESCLISEPVLNNESGQYMEEIYSNQPDEYIEDEVIMEEVYGDS